MTSSLQILRMPVISSVYRMCQTVVLATPNVFAISLRDLFCFLVFHAFEPRVESSTEWKMVDFVKPFELKKKNHLFNHMSFMYRGHGPKGLTLFQYLQEYSQGAPVFTELG